jgi:hypothetical protein
MMTEYQRVLWAMALAVGAAACSTGGSEPTGGGQQVAFNIATRPGAALATAAVVGTPETVTVGVNTLSIEQVQLVLRNIRFHRVEGTSTCDDSPSSGNATLLAALHEGDQEGQDGHADDCEIIRVGPYLLDLPLGAGAARLFTVPVDTGTYDEVKFKLHKVGDDPGDSAFIAQNPDFDSISVRVTGTFNGSPFTFVSRVSAEQGSHLTTPLVVSDSTGAQVTIMVDLSTWFVAPGGELIDPAQALPGQPEEEVVRDNIKRSFHAFEDDNCDGREDHHEGGSHG